MIMKREIFDEKPSRQYGHCSLVFFTILFIIFIFSPTYIAVGAHETLKSITLWTVVLVIAVISLLPGVSVFLLRHNYMYLEGLITGLLFLCFINAFVFPFQAELLDGKQEFGGIRENAIPLIRNIVLFVILSGLALFFRKPLRFSAVPLLIIAVVFSFINMNTINQRNMDADKERLAEQEIFESASTFSTESNVVVIILDMFQGSVAERTFMLHPGFFESFDGFTVFSHTISSFASTQFSNAVIHSGKIYSADDPSYEANISASIGDSFMMDMENEGYRVNMLGVSTRTRFPEFPVFRFISNEETWITYNSASSAALARVTGYWIQSPFFVLNPSRNESWDHSEFAIMINQMVSDIELIDALTDNFSVSDEEKKLLYFWYYALHYPTVITADGEVDIGLLNEHSERDVIYEASFTLAQLTRLFDAMKVLDVYDNSLIIIVSDHGGAMRPAALEEHREFIEHFTDGKEAYGNHWNLTFYNSVLMVKPPDSQGEAIISHDPAWNGDVRALVNYYHNNSPGKSPKDVIADIRSEKPEIGVMFLRSGTENYHMSTEDHEILYITSLSEIAEAFSLHSSTGEN